MYSYRDYCASSRRNHRVTENGTMGRHTSSSPPPVLSDGKRRTVRDRLQGITAAMAWIKDELNDLKESDRALIDIFKQLQGDVGELNTYVSSHRNSGSISGVSAVKEEKVQPQSMDASLELDFSVLDSTSQNGEVDDETFSDTSSPVQETRGFTGSGASSGLEVGSSRDDLRPSSNHTHKDKDDQKAGNVEDLLETPSGLSISLGSLDLDFSTTNFGLGTITEGGSLMNIPINTTASSSSGSSKGDSPSSNKLRAGNFQRSLSQQPLPGSGVPEKSRRASHQPPKQPPPQTLPKPRRGSWFSRQNPPAPKKPSVTSQQRPVISMVRQSSVGSTGSPQQPRKDISAPLQANQGSSSPSPPQERKKAGSPPRVRKESKVLKPILSSQAQQELKDVARQLKHESKSSKSASSVQKVPNGALPQFQRDQDGTRGSPLLLRRQPPPQPKQPSPPLSSRPVESLSPAKPPTHRTSPPQPLRVSPTPPRPQAQLSTASELKGSSSMNRLTPNALKAQEETLSNISRNSSIDSGIQFASEGENGGGVHTDAGSSRGNVGNTVGSTVEGKTGGGDKDTKLGGGEEVDGLGFGDFASDVFSALASMNGKSWTS